MGTRVRAPRPPDWWRDRCKTKQLAIKRERLIRTTDPQAFTSSKSQFLPTPLLFRARPHRPPDTEEPDFLGRGLPGRQRLPLAWCWEQHFPRELEYGGAGRSQPSPGTTVTPDGPPRWRPPAGVCHGQGHPGCERGRGKRVERSRGPGPEQCLPGLSMGRRDKGRRLRRARHPEACRAGVTCRQLRPLQLPEGGHLKYGRDLLAGIPGMPDKGPRPGGFKQQEWVCSRCWARGAKSRPRWPWGLRGRTLPASGAFSCPHCRLGPARPSSLCRPGGLRVGGSLPSPGFRTVLTQNGLLFT